MNAAATTALQVVLPDGFSLPIAFSGEQGVAEIITAAVVEGDLPRRDFQGQRVPWVLLDANDTAVDSTATLRSAGIAPGSQVRLHADVAGEVLRQRDEWLAQISNATASGTSGSVNEKTLAALIRRTGSKEHELATLLAATPAPAIQPVELATVEPTESRLPLYLGGAALALFLVAAWMWAFTGAFSGGDDPLAIDDRRTWPLDIEGELENPGDVGSHEFQGRAGDRVRIEMRVPGQSFDAELLLFDADGELIASNDDNPIEGCCDSLIDIELPEDGTYEIAPKALSDDSSGSYRVTVADGADFEDTFGLGNDGNPEPPFGGDFFEGEDIAMPVDAPPGLDPTNISAEEIFSMDAETIVLGEQFESDYVIERGERIIVAFEAAEGDSVQIVLSSAELDPWLGLWIEDDLIDQNDDTDGLNSEIELTIPATGTYRIEARDLGGGGAGDLRLVVATR